MHRATVTALLVVGFSLAWAMPAAAKIDVYRDFASFHGTMGPLTDIDFEDVFFVTIRDVTFRNPFFLRTGFCAAPTCDPDPDNLNGGNIALFLDVYGSVRLPSGVGVVSLLIQGIGENTFDVEVTDGAGDTFTLSAQGVTYGITYVNASSPAGVRQIEVLRTDGGALVLTTVRTFDLGGGLRDEIDFESLPAEGQCILSVCESRTVWTDVTLPDPGMLHGATFSDPQHGRLAFCSAPTCQIDPDSPTGNVVIFLDPGATIEFPPGTAGAMLVVEGVGSNAFTIEATDRNGDSVTADAAGVPFGITWLGFISVQGLAKLRVVSVGGTGGPLAVSGVFYGPALEPNPSEGDTGGPPGGGDPGATDDDEPQHPTTPKVSPNWVPLPVFFLSVISAFLLLVLLVWKRRRYPTEDTLPAVADES